jgi:hypothetical protein
MEMGLLRLIAVWGLLCCVGCSVKEDRERCPCLLRLDLSYVDTSAVNVADLFLSGPEGYEFSESLELNSCDGEYDILVPQGEVSVWLYSGLDGESAGAEGLKIPYGEDCPPVYMHSSVVAASGEFVTETVHMRKNHCILTVYVKSEELFPYSFRFSGGVNGYGVRGEPSEGAFSYSVNPDQDNMCVVCLPRQVDDSLMLEIVDDSDVLRRFTLGEYISEAGYDWREEDLRDVTVGIDFVVSQFTIAVSDWDDTHVYDVVI